MEWIKIEDFYYSKALMKDPSEFTEVTSAYGTFGKEAIVLVKYDTGEVIKKTVLNYRRYKSIDDVTEDVKLCVDAGHYMLKEYDDKTVAVFSFSMASFNNILAYMFIDDMINEYKEEYGMD